MMEKTGSIKGKITATTQKELKHTIEKNADNTIVGKITKNSKNK